MLYINGIGKKKASSTEKRDALLAEMASLRDLLNGSFVQPLSAENMRQNNNQPNNQRCN